MLFHNDKMSITDAAYFSEKILNEYLKIIFRKTNSDEYFQ